MFATYCWCTVHNASVRSVRSLFPLTVDYAYDNDVDSVCTSSHSCIYANEDLLDVYVDSCKLHCRCVYSPRAKRTCSALMFYDTYISCFKMITGRVRYSAQHRKAEQCAKNKNRQSHEAPSSKTAFSPSSILPGGNY